MAQNLNVHDAVADIYRRAMAASHPDSVQLIADLCAEVQRLAIAVDAILSHLEKSRSCTPAKAAGRPQPKE